MIFHFQVNYSFKTLLRQKNDTNFTKKIKQLNEYCLITCNDEAQYPTIANIMLFRASVIVLKQQDKQHYCTFRLIK